jgi:hypothetical protein
LEVVDLVLALGVDRPHVEVNSYEGEGAFVLRPVLADVEPLHEAHVVIVLFHPY